MTFQTLSQTISIKEPRVKTLVNNQDTLIVFKLNDAKILLTDVLMKQEFDTLLAEYEHMDSLKSVRLDLQDTIIVYLKTKIVKQEMIEKNLNVIIENKDKEITILNGTIEKQKTEIKKQKFYKLIGFTAAIALPILAIIFL
jgi:3-isopropylmalate dehydratase small subunit